MKDNDKKIVLNYTKEHPEGITSLDFDKWGVSQGITLDNAKRRLRELKEEGYVRSEWEISPARKRYKRYFYIPREEQKAELSELDILRNATR